MARWLLGVTLVVLAALAFVPTGMSSGYSCDGPPVTRLLDPDIETGSQYFFDVGAACNDHARRRGWVMGATAAIGLGSSGAFALVARRGGASAEPVGDEHRSSIW